ncbi:MAG: hypothetical protein UD103_02875 [Bacteroidales bacterium]|nr:hypothetical protein [Bacteroidales bacterium]
MARPFVELYINEQKVYFKEPPEIFVTYAHTDLHNPTVVKNSFTKTVTIEGTPENNRIFNNFYDLKRINNNELFNPSRKETFTLYRNGEPMETGYVKLDKVNKKNGRITYDITLYGGLGQFLYNLQYKEDGEQMKLSDLEYNTDFNFTVDKNTIKDAWRHITGMKEVDSKYDIINFAPCYNGIPKDFAADKVAIDVWSFKANNPRLYEQFTTSKDGYGLVDNKWLLGELNKDYDEWQVKDLRSYLQRPVIRFKEVIQACCNPKNNGGYRVDLDVDFFNTENQYYENAWMTLPLLSEMEIENEGEYNITITQNEDKFMISGGENGSFVSLTFELGAYCRANTAVGSLSTNRYMQSWDGSDESSPTDESTNVARMLQLVVYDVNGKEVRTSDVYALYTYGGMSDYFYFGKNVNRVNGVYYKQSDGTYMFGADEIKIAMKNLKYSDGMYFKIKETFEYSQAGYIGPNYKELYYREEAGYDDNDNITYNTIPVSVSSFFNTLSLVETVTTKKVKEINKKALLNSENTPCDYFLSYLKMFNLHIWKDMYENLIYVRQRKNFFVDEVKDVEDWVDRGDNITIKPLTFENKWLNFNFETIEDSALAKNYVDDFGIKYGCQKVDTNYNFDNSSKDLFDGNVFKNAIQCRGKSRYYTDIYQSYSDDDVFYPPFMLDGCKTYLFNGLGDTTDGSAITPKNTQVAINWWKEKYYDFMPKPSFVNKDNEGVDGSNVLLFYNGRTLMEDVDGNRLRFQITDDIPQFEVLNDGEPCWIWSMDWDVSIDYMTYFPVFSRYITNENGWVTHSWDFGTPKYLYVPDYSIDDSSNLYTQYWKSYIRDQYDADTKVVECKVLLKERVIGDWLQRFYYWDGRYWILNKITDYNPSSNGTTKCEFVSVNNINNYLS